MTVHLRPRRARRPRVAPPAAPIVAIVPPPARPAAAARRERDAGGPDDRALYHCHCGFVFDAAVTTSVRCPHCGSGQAW